MVGPQGPANRVLTVGEVVELPEIQARIFVAQGTAKLADAVKSAKNEYKADAVDGDGDGKVQDGTEFERPAKAKSTPAKKSR